MFNTPTLFVSLGTSPAIVPEAFLLPGIQFRTVHVLTTKKPEVSLIQEYFTQHAPTVELTLTRVAGFDDFQSENDHFLFEEVLYRWVLSTRTPPVARYFCLSGGFKTMSAAMQKAATVLGAAEVFHVLADNGPTSSHGDLKPPSTIEEILAARDADRLHWIKLGPESGWPQLQTANPSDYPLETVAEVNGVRSVKATGQCFRTRLSQIVDRSHRIAGAWDQLHNLPFSELATWSEAELARLRQPLNYLDEGDSHWTAALPKVELHCHLGGFATHGKDLDRVRAAAEHPDLIPALKDGTSVEPWPIPDKPVQLQEYMRLGDNNGSVLLKDPGCLRKQCKLLYEHLLQQRVHYAEIRCSPANYATSQRSPWDVLCDIREHFQQCMQQAADPNRLDDLQECYCHINLILIATRRPEGDYRAAIARHLALALTASEHWTDPETCRVVGVDLAGYEDATTRAHYFREEFTAVHRCGLALTVHAGENDDAEGIWRAVFDLNARRLGHALSLNQSPELLRSITDRGIGVEMCPYANLQIHGFALDEAVETPGRNNRYPLRKYLEAGARVTVNTDNIGISAASLTENLLLAARLCPGLTRLDLLKLQKNAIETAFLPAHQRTQLTGRLAAGIPKL